ncbi:MAG: D-alanine--D-alanine ligase family protein [Candidatus Limnocylindrus sp.]
MSGGAHLPNVVTIYGGLSAEAEISVVSGSAIAAALMERGLSVDQLLITREGVAALLPEGHLRGARPPHEYTSARGVAAFADVNFRPLRELLAEVLHDRPSAVFIPALHGPGDESGVVQEALAAAGVAFVGAAPAAARLGMEKDAFKQLARSLHVPTLPHLVITAREWASAREATLEAITEFAARESDAGALMCKPAAHGSSIGMRIARSREEWAGAVDHALEFGERALLEPYLNRPRELEIALLESPDGSVSAYGPGEVFPGREFYDYDAKYASGVSTTTVSPELSEPLRTELHQAAIKLFRAFGGRGLARMDFLMRASGTEQGAWYISEVNTFPGFTPISLFPALLAAHGMSFADLSLHLVRTAIAQQRDGR